jgi:predicted AAA+ superfamily ATPase
MLKKTAISNEIKEQRSKLEENTSGLRRNALLNLAIEENFALIISGIRRCGKSTLMRQFISERKIEDYLFLNFDSAKLFQFEMSDFQLLDELISEEKARFLIFDEIQVVEGWELYIRQKLDEGFKVMISGSNASLLSKELGTKLTGRHITKELFPFSFNEFVAFHEYEYDEKALGKFLDLGGFPGYLATQNTDILNALLDDLIYRDIAVRHNIRDVRTLKHLLVYLATNISNLVSATKLKQYLGVKSTATVLEYFSYFEAAYLIQLVPKFSYSHKVQIVNPRKIYFLDNGLQQAIVPKFSEDLGRRLENMVFWELRRQGKNIFYFNENGGECDFVVFSNAQIESAIQVCYEMNLENEKREIFGLLEAMKFFELSKGYILTFNQSDVIITEGKRIELVPVHLFFNNRNNEN